MGVDGRTNRRRGRWSLAVLAATAVMVSGVGCSTGGSTTASSPVPRPSASSHPPKHATSPSPIATYSPHAKPSPTPTSSGASSASLEDGRHLVFIKGVRTQGATGAALRFDLTEWYSGEAATRAAIEDGAIEPGEQLPNDYYIRNNNPMLRTMAVVAGAKVLVIDWSNCCDTFAGDLGQLADGIASGRHNEGNYRASSPYWLRVQGGEIVKIQEQYLP